MALDNQVDNQGIKKGLGLVVSQLIQSNQKLDSQESGNLFKELRQNNRLTEKLLSEKLKDDFNTMNGSGMFYEEPPSFEEIIQRLGKLEQQINKDSEPA